MSCERCHEKEEHGLSIYCEECIDYFRGGREIAHERAYPAPGVHVTGKLNPRECPKSSYSGECCGLCGFDELEPGYGFAGGYGLGSYNYCPECHAIMDFSEDMG